MYGGWAAPAHCHATCTTVTHYVLLSRIDSYCEAVWNPIIAEQAEPHRHHGKQKETHEGFSLWLSWLAVLLVGAYARRRRRRRRRSRATWRPDSKNRLTETTVYFFDIRHPCYDQMTPVKTSRPVSRPVSRDHIAGSSLQLIEFTCFCEVDR